MDWQRILGALTVSRLSRLAHAAGIGGRSRMRKAQLVEAICGELDEPLKREALRCFRGSELRALAHELELRAPSTRRHDLSAALLATPADEVELELGEDDMLLPDRQRLDLPRGDRDERAVEVIPARPGASDAAMFFELQELLRRPTLRRAVIVTPDCRASVVARMLGEGLDDFIEGAARWRPAARDDRPLVTIVLDGELHGLDESESGGTLVSLAHGLPNKLEIRLAARRLFAKVFAFEEHRPEGPWLTAFVGSSHAQSDVAADRALPANAIEADVRLSGPLDSGGEVGLAGAWVTHMLSGSKRLADALLNALPAEQWVMSKVAYKLDFDTAHELRLKHLAERLSRRGRHAGPMFDPTAIETLPWHQRLAVAGAARPWSEGMLLLDESGLGKTVETGLILARELRRRRVYASSDAADRRRALVVAPRSRHAHWLEELEGKLALAAVAIDDVAAAIRPDAQVVIVSPKLLAASDELQGFDVVVADEAGAYDDAAMTAVAAVRAGAELGVVCSAVPVRDEASDIVPLAALAAPSEGLDAYLEVEAPGYQALLGKDVRAIAARTRRKKLIDDGRLARRELADRYYALDEAEAAAYLEIRRMRSDYTRRSGQTTAWAFVALEQAFLSSPQAFAAASRIDALERRDASRELLASSGYFRRRLAAVREKLGARALPDAPRSVKEKALAAILAEQPEERAVVFTRQRATQERLGRVLGREGARVEELDASSSLRERLRVVERAAQSGAVLIATDDAARGLSLQRGFSLLVNYDLPWNPQAIEERIRRLERWGRTGVVRVYNLAAKSPRVAAGAAEGWTMDARVLYACRKLFNMSDPVAVASEALHEVDPHELEQELAREDEVELSLIDDPAPEALAAFEAMLAGEAPAAWREAAELGAAEEERYRRELAEFWSQVSYGARGLEGARGHFFERLRLALLQGQVGVLCAPGRTIDQCSTFHVAVGLRILYENALVDGDLEPMDEQWLIEDEEVHLWAVAPDGTLVDWSGFLMGDSLPEVAPERAVKIAGEEIVEWLTAKKRSLESRDLDALPLEVWRSGAPGAVDGKLAVAERHAAAMARARLAQLGHTWAEAKAERLERLRARRAALPSDAPEEFVAAADRLVAAAEQKSVRWRHAVLGTQLFLVMN